jgi:benzoate/toluate 1,2-dioxygenase alpha subunit
MGKYRGNPEAIRMLVGEDRVHRDVYIDPELFEIEMETLWPSVWIYLGHESQIPNPGDFYTTTIGIEPVIMIRHSDGTIRVLRNRCAHKGARVLTAISGSAGRFLRCPYHAWVYRTDGALHGVPFKGGYDGTRMWQSEAARGLAAVPNVENYRGFVFVRLAERGTGFREYFGDSLSSIDYMVDRSPKGALEVAGGCLRYLHDCNWKMFVENLNDTMHPMVTHELAAGAARALWAEQSRDVPPPMVVEQLAPFASGYSFFDQMGVRVYDNGHSFTGVNFSIHSAYSPIAEYDRAMAEAYGERAKNILGTVRHNTVYYPSLTIKGAIQAIRVVRPLAVDRTLIESWTFRLIGAPDALLARTVMYTRLINSPMSVVGHDDRHNYRSIQEGLRANGNEWISLHRNYDPTETSARELTTNGTSEISMRNQFRAWAKFMTTSERSLNDGAL